MIFNFISEGMRFEVCEKGYSLIAHTKRPIVWLDGTISFDTDIEQVQLEVGDVIEFSGMNFKGLGFDEFPEPFFRGTNFYGSFSDAYVNEIPDGVLKRVPQNTPISTLKLQILDIQLTQIPIKSQDTQIEAANLSDFLLSKRFPFSNVETDILPDLFDVQLKYVINAKLERIQEVLKGVGYGFKSPYKNWQYKSTLDWSNESGWNVSNDEEIAICRKGYDDYYLFVIEKIGDIEKDLKVLPLPEGWITIPIEQKLEYSDIFGYLSFLYSEPFGNPDGKAFMKKKEVKELLKYGISYNSNKENERYELNMNRNKYRTKTVFYYCMHNFMKLCLSEFGVKKEFVSFIFNRFTNFDVQTFSNFEKNFTGERPKYAKIELDAFEKKYIEKIKNIKKNKPL